MLIERQAKLRELLWHAEWSIWSTQRSKPKKILENSGAILRGPSGQRGERKPM